MNNLSSPTQASDLLSALADGEVGSEELAAVLHSSGAGNVSGEDFARWSGYHLIGDVLRSQASAAIRPDRRFVERLNLHLAREPMVAAKARPAFDPAPPRTPASNDESFRWKLVAGVASLAAVSAISWNAFGLFSPAVAPQLALSSAPQQVLVPSQLGPVLRDARLEELLAAHRQLGGASALQSPSNFFRNATFDAPPDARR